jgi:hypothetical protein
MRDENVMKSYQIKSIKRELEMSYETFLTPHRPLAATMPIETVLPLLDHSGAHFSKWYDDAEGRGQDS